MIASLAGAASAHAHGVLEHSLPPAGGRITTPQTELDLHFTKGVESLFSTIELRNESGTAIAIGKPHTAPDDYRKLSVGPPTLSPGTYKDVWHVTSVDARKTQGSFAFTVAR